MSGKCDYFGNVILLYKSAQQKLLVQLLSQALIYGHVSFWWVDVNSNETFSPRHSVPLYMCFWRIATGSGKYWFCVTELSWKSDIDSELVQLIATFSLGFSNSCVVCIIHMRMLCVCYFLLVTFVMLHLCTCISPNRSPSHWWITISWHSRSATWPCGPGPDLLQED